MNLAAITIGSEVRLPDETGSTERSFVSKMPGKNQLAVAEFPSLIALHSPHALLETGL
jgi:hypothetical protein